MWTQDDWTGCYPSSWRGVIVSEAMVHPAKFSSKLIRRIYEHMQAEGWIKEGDTVMDCFGGVSLGALDAMRLGLRWRGVELEAKFVDLGNANISLWNKKYSRAPHWCQDAVLVKGDSRKLLEILRGSGARGIVSSPPYADGAQHTGGDDLHPEKMQGGVFHGVGLQGAVSSPPYADSVNQGDGANDEAARLERKARAGVDNSRAVTRGGPNSVLNQAQVYGQTEGQLGGMKADGFDAAISSPPFEQRSADGGWQMLGKYAEEGKLTVKQVKGDSGKSYPSWDKARDTSYGESEGQLSNMDSGGFDAAISSPPYKNETQGGGLNVNKPESFRGVLKDGSLSMGESEGNLGQMDDTNFQAAISSPPFRQSEGGTPEPKPNGSIDKALYARHAAGNSAAEGYGGTEGQLANMEEGSFDAAVSSPPYNLPMSQTHNGKRGGKRGTTPSEQGAFVKYGNEEGQLEGMDMDGFDAAVSSPPFESVEGRHSADKFKDPEESARVRSEGYQSGRLKGHYASKEAILRSMQKANEQTYGDTDGNIGNDTGDDFWLAARQIVEQVYLALEPGGHAVWVLKRFVKDKKIVEFPDQWRQLCEAVGFKTLHWHRALLVRSNGKSHLLEGGTVEHTKASKSFFRRLAESKGSPKIDWEDVICMVKE